MIVKVHRMADKSKKPKKFKNQQQQPNKQINK